MQSLFAMAGASAERGLRKQRGLPVKAGWWSYIIIFSLSIRCNVERMGACKCSLTACLQGNGRVFKKAASLETRSCRRFTLQGSFILSCP